MIKNIVAQQGRSLYEFNLEKLAKMLDTFTERKDQQNISIILPYYELILGDVRESGYTDLIEKYSPAWENAIACLVGTTPAFAPVEERSPDFVPRERGL